MEEKTPLLNAESSIRVVLLTVVAEENIARLDVRQLTIQQIFARPGENEVDLAVALMAVAADLAARRQNHLRADSALAVHLVGAENVELLQRARAALEVFHQNRLCRQLSFK